ncbi:MAG: hypothetical protein KA807_20345 [Prolixibacteraceae bacterium]|nr:hypothetical protein [Prolixibacteraceae bacterium]
MKDKKTIVSNVKHWTKWWTVQRKRKLEEQLNETMSINPFMMPFLFDYHDLSNIEELVDLIVASHLMTGHATGFGKLIDEKILPNVFDTKKLDSQFRKETKPFNESCFDEIDHLVLRSNGSKQLLSLKAGRWTIQLTMAVQLNKAFNEIINRYSSKYNKIVVGVFYGKDDELTDKYEILRGINRGANHDVINLSNSVEVYSGKNFWSWLNDGQDATQEWVMQGIIEALKEEKIHETASALLNRFKEGVVTKYESDIKTDGVIDWYKLLRKING